MLVRHILSCTVLAFALIGAAPGLSSAQSPDTPQGLLQLWRATLERGDYSAYLECLHAGARLVPEYASPEAMTFWAGEMRDLARKGFDGRFELEVVTDPGDRFPAGSVRAYPIVNGSAIAESIVLVQQAGQWTILRVFS